MPAIKHLPLRSRDVFVKVLTKCKRYRVCAATTSQMLRDTIRRHPRAAESAVALGQVVSGTSLMANVLDGEERITCEFSLPNGRALVCEANAVGECRAHVSPSASMPGIVRVSRVLYGQAEAVVSITSLPQHAANHESCETADFHRHLAYYFQQSETIPSAVFVTAECQHGVVAHSGGALVQALPTGECDGTKERDTVISMLQKYFGNYSGGSSSAHAMLAGLDEEERKVGAPAGSLLLQRLLFMATSDSAGVAATLRKCRFWQTEGGRVACGLPLLELDPDTLVCSPLDFFCRCSRASFADALASLGREECLRLSKEYPNMPMTCRFCSQVHSMDPPSWAELIHRISEADCRSRQ